MRFFEQENQLKMRLQVACLVLALAVFADAQLPRIKLNKMQSVSEQLNEVGSRPSLFRYKYLDLLGPAPEPLSNYMDVSQIESDRSPQAWS